MRGRQVRHPVAIRGAAVAAGATLAAGPKPALFGTAHVFGTSAEFSAEDGSPWDVRILAGAFDAHMRDVWQWRAPAVSLQIDHDPRQVLCSTRDRSLMVWSDKAAVRFRVDPRSINGRRAIDAIRARPDLRQVSVGAAGLAGAKYARPDGDPPLFVAARGRLIEISLVSRARFAQTAAFVARQGSPESRSPAPPPIEPRGRIMSHRDHTPEDRALVRILAAEAGHIQTSTIDERAVGRLIAGGLVTAGAGGLRLTAAGRARACSVDGAPRFHTSSAAPLIRT